MAGLNERINDGPMPRQRPAMPSVRIISRAVPVRLLRWLRLAVCMRVLITAIGSVATELSDAAWTPSAQLVLRND